MPAMKPRRCRDARGFTLVELVLAASLLLPLAVVAAGLALHALRGLAWAANMADRETALESAAQILEAELAPLVPADGVLQVAPDRVRIRAVRATGRWCLRQATGIVVPVATGLWAASRLPVAGRDSVVLEYADSLAPGGVRRVRHPLASPPTAAACGVGPPGLFLETGPLASAPGPDELFGTEEVVELAGYVSGGSTWLGMLHLGLGTPIEPLAGPFAPGGVHFQGLDSLGVPTLVPGQIFSMRVQLLPSGTGATPRTLHILLRG